MSPEIKGDSYNEEDDDGDDDGTQKKRKRDVQKGSP